MQRLPFSLEWRVWSLFAGEPKIAVRDFNTAPRIEISGPCRLEDFDAFTKNVSELFPRLYVNCKHDPVTNRSTASLTIHQKPKP